VRSASIVAVYLQPLTPEARLDSPHDLGYTPG
jgi:hypothetical protein